MRPLFILWLLAFLVVPQVTNAGSSDNLSGWAWSSTIGWVSFNSTTGGGVNHGVNVAANGLMGGYAWSPNVGWISFNSSQLGGCPSGTCQARFDKQTGAVTGWARALAGSGSSIQTGGWGGWIQLSGGGGTVDTARWKLLTSVNTKICSDDTLLQKPLCPQGIVDGSSSDGYSNGYRCKVHAYPGNACVGQGSVYGIVEDYESVVTTGPAAAYAVSANGCEWQGNAWGGGPSLQNGVIGWLSFRGSGYGVTGSGVACAGGTLNLTASGITPTTATPGVARAFTSTIANSGPAATGGSFSALFQRATDAAGSNAVDLGTVSLGTLTPGGTVPASLNATLSAGTWYLRTCADKASSSDAGLITESSEIDNCGPWTAVTVSSVGAGVSCNVSSTSVIVGSTVTYTASPSGTASSPYRWVSPDGAGGFGSGSTASRTFSSTGMYGMTVEATPSSASATCPYVRVTSPAACTGSLTATLTATPSRVRSGTSTTLTWTASGVNTSCTVTGTDGFTQTTSATACNVPITNVTRSINTQSTYSISCDGGPVLDTITVNVIPNFIEF